MARGTRILLGIGLLSVVGNEAATAETLSLTVQVRNDAHVGADTLEAARQIVADIYSHAGLELIWSNDDAEIMIILRPRASKETARRVPDAMGYTPGGGEARGRLAFVMINRVREIAADHGAARSVVLGAAIAHELGHLLLSKEHSTTGIMRPYLNQSDFRNVRNGRLVFTDNQVDLIRKSVSAAAAPPAQHDADAWHIADFAIDDWIAD